VLAKLGLIFCKSDIEIKRMNNVKSTQKSLLFFLNMAIVASLCFASQNNVLAKSKMPIEDKVISPPLSPDLTWKSLGNVKKDVHAHGQILTLNGDAFESIEDGRNKNSENVFQYYSSENLQSLGWTFIGGVGVDLTYQHVSGIYLTVQIEKCANFETYFCVNIWHSTDVGSTPLSDVSAAAVDFGKTAPVNGATIPLPTTAYQLLQWSDAQKDSGDRYEYCIDETNNSTCGNDWISRNSLYSGDGEFTVLSGHTYYWQVRLRDAGISANSGAWWSFTVGAALGFPSAKSIVRANPSPTHASSVSYTVTFDQGVTGVDTSDFSLATTGISDAVISGVTGSSGGNTYTVTVSTGIGSGTVKLNLIDNDSIKNIQSTPLGGTGTGNGNYTAGETYSIDRTFKIIYGNVGTDGATLSYIEDGMQKTTTSLADGSYIFAVFSGWTGTVTPFKVTSTFYLFSPRNRSYINLSVNQAAQDYTVTQVTLYRSLLPLILR
jgi:hypothetical protein